MAMYHCHVQAISRGSGRSSVAAAAYRSGTRLIDERTGTVHDYTRKGGIVHSEVILPDDAPQYWRDRSQLWNDAERAERGSNACVAREVEYALPREFDLQTQIEFARTYAQTFADEGMCVDFSIHDERNGNPHVHMLLASRPCDAGGFSAKSENVYLVRDNRGNERHATAAELVGLGESWAKVYRYKSGEELTQRQAELAGMNPTKDRKSKTPVQETRYLTDWHEPEKVTEWREQLARMQNERLAALGADDRVDHRSYADRGIDQLPTAHEGYAVRQAEAIAQNRARREGCVYQPVTARRHENQRIRELNRRLMQMVERAKRSFTQFRRSIQTAERNQSNNARKRSLQLQRAERKTARHREHGGLSR